MALRLNVRRGNNVFEVKHEKGLTVAAVKKLIQDQEQIPPDQQHLLLGNVELTEDQDLSRLKLGELHLVTQQDMSSCLNPAWKGADPAWEKSVRLALQLDQEEKARFQGTDEPGLGHQWYEQEQESLLLAQKLQEEEEAKEEEARQAEELSLQLIQKLLNGEQQADQPAVKTKQQEQLQQEQLQREQEAQEEEACLLFKEELQRKLFELEKEEQQQLEDAKDTEHSRAWEELQRSQQFELDNEDEKLRVQEDEKRFSKTQVARNRNEEAKEVEKEGLLLRKQDINKNLVQQLDTATALNARSQEAEMKLAAMRQQREQEQAKQDQVRAAVRAEVARQEAARLAALTRRPDPNLYMYPPGGVCMGGYMDATVTVRLAPFWVMSFVEPAVTSGGVNAHHATWNVSVNQQGKLRDQTGESRRYIKYDMLTTDSDALLRHFAMRTSNTFCVSLHDCETFFERALRKLGLEGQEITDMVAFCRPMMAVSEWTNITFVTTAIYDEMLALSIRPAPQQLIRVFAVLRNVPGWDASAKATLDSLPTPPLRNSSQFVAVEWGAANTSRWDAISSIMRAEVQEAEEAEQMRTLAEQNAQDAQSLRALREQNALSIQAVTSQEIALRNQEESLQSMRQAHANERAQFRSQRLYFGS
eukprot:gb/GEZN01003010.1/.p1 GENE.gb/GEZN01003010.1/~~gb/GEZN01003010.1/.p1  ORF type:complete len:656 (-),score=167.67 gb/GEZN01003010.1/:334-2268(-)